ncbi:hypothetical protein [Natrinema sp. HArc-T2]|uniref:hypothetical protein n=1 Tax=Natrinema sp. HArc-T2 TaxID=3242701 RepID=UPI00359EE357
MVNRDIATLVADVRIADRGPTIDRYDLLLGLIPAAFLVVFLASRLLALPPEATALGGSVIAALALLDGLFVRPPMGPAGHR